METSQAIRDGWVAGRLKLASIECAIGVVENGTVASEILHQLNNPARVGSEYNHEREIDGFNYLRNPAIGVNIIHRKGHKTIKITRSESA